MMQKDHRASAVAGQVIEANHSCQAIEERETWIVCPKVPIHALGQWACNRAH